MSEGLVFLDAREVTYCYTVAALNEIGLVNQPRANRRGYTVVAEDDVVIVDFDDVGLAPRTARRKYQEAQEVLSAWGLDSVRKRIQLGGIAEEDFSYIEVTLFGSQRTDEDDSCRSCGLCEVA